MFHLTSVTIQKEGRAKKQLYRSHPRETTANHYIANAKVRTVVLAENRCPVGKN